MIIGVGRGVFELGFSEQGKPYTIRGVPLRQSGLSPMADTRVLVRLDKQSGQGYTPTAGSG